MSIEYNNNVTPRFWVLALGHRGRIRTLLGKGTKREGVIGKESLSKHSIVE